jgi:ABC-type transport system involved in multi-copper enzyme maturation permease subunit
MSAPLNGHGKRMAPPVHEGFVVAPLVRMALQANLRSRRFLVALLVGLIPVLLGLALIAADAENAKREGRGFAANVADPLAFVVVGATVPFVAMLLAGSIVADEVEDRTLSYLLVRPLRRRQLYLSRLLPAAILAAGLAAAQALAFVLLRLLSWALYGQGTHQSIVVDGSTRLVATIDVIAAQGALGVLAASLAALAFLALFTFVTVLTTKYHFIANLLVFAAVELPFGNLGGQGAGVLTVTFHARSLLQAFGSAEASYHAAPWWLALPALLLMAGLWTWAGMRQVGRRDFNVTSAAS